MRYMVEHNFVEVLGKIWLPFGQLATYTYELNERDVNRIGTPPTRKNVEDWLGCNAGDFSAIIDFRASIGDAEVPWEKEENECLYNDITYPED